MTATALFALILLSQTSDSAPIPALVPRTVAVNDTVTLEWPMVAALDLETLHDLFVLTRRQDLDDAAKQSRYETMLKEGKVAELHEPIRFTLRSIAPDDFYRDNRTGKPTMIYSGLLLDGPAARRTVFLIKDQVDTMPATTELKPPSAEELAQAQADDKAAAERDAVIYRAYRSGKAAAKAKAAASDASIRRKVEQHAMTDLRDRLAKKHHLKEGELDAIVARGEDKDGTAARMAAKHSPAIAAAKARNDQQLMAIGAVINANAQRILNTPQWRPTPMVGRSFNPLGWEGHFYASPHTNTITSDRTFRPMPGR